MHITNGSLFIVIWIKKINYLSHFDYYSFSYCEIIMIWIIANFTESIVCRKSYRLLENVRRNRPYFWKT